MRKGILEVSVRSEGRNLPEYQVDPVDDRTLACYIPSEVGKTFEICWRGDTRRDKYDSTMRCSVDGRSAGGTFCMRGIVDISRWGIRDAANRRKPFVFAPLATTDDESLAVSLEAHPDLGTIDVKLLYAVRLGTTHFKQRPDAIQPSTVHEKSKKMGVHCVSLGDSRECERHDKVKIKPINKSDPVYARFIFRYRSKDFLQAEGIMPLDEGNGGGAHSPAPSGRKRRSAGLHPDILEAGPNRKRARKNDPAAPARTVKDVKPSAAELAGNEYLGDLQPGHGSVQGRAQSLETRTKGLKGSDSSQRVKRERRGIAEDVIDLTGSDVKKERSPIRLEASGVVIDLTLDD
ncbi:uncharacterized protein C8Q71DRAFT_774667 [Rhodofomes roseus]|uniref:DUF7918 domain-containing protein n=1 Tax=Rhodofomes roseus TaxID=34475 RepID=A0ABQ8K7H8_9APHY|nr:uncharacterized protein C8Q71DRAFT_774667 [Rhodofomes roseus]KAH9833217.1 hypothetical protein C8Q71DRAFT_774667 [Rhodofomes roseus]